MVASYKLLDCHLAVSRIYRGVRAVHSGVNLLSTRCLLSFKNTTNAYNFLQSVLFESNKDDDVYTVFVYLTDYGGSECSSIEDLVAILAYILECVGVFDAFDQVALAKDRPCSRVDEYLGH